MTGLIKEAFEECRILTKTGVTPDGEGGYINTWVDGPEFLAAFDFQTGMQAKIGEKQGVTGLWNIYVSKSTSLEFHNVFRRMSDGQIFRVTSKDDKATPKGASLDLRMLSAEEWELT